METIFLIVALTSMLIVFGVDAARKRREYLAGK